MHRCDALIVGGGPAGSTCARALVQAGLDVVVLDRAVFPRDKICAGWITPPVVDLLQLSLAEYGQSRVCQPITGFRTCRMGGPVLDTRFDGPVSYGICRAEFDHYLLQRAGARVVDGTPVTSLRRADGRWTVNEAFEAPVIVGAGGHFCPVARHLGARPGDEPVVAAQEVEFRMTPEQAARCRVEAETPELHLCRDLRGYGWCFRKGDRLNIGLGRQDPHELPRQVRAFLADLVAAGTMPPDVPTRWKGHAYLLRDLSRRRVFDTGALVIGDAAGLASTVSGEGIRPAIESGLIAASTLIQAAGQYHREQLQPYQDRLDARFPRASHTVIGAMPPSMLVPLVGRLLGTSWFTRRVLLERWFLQAA